MASLLQSQTSRTNGAHSTGPTTPEGKARSSQNAVKHGLFSQQLLLPHESPEEFAALRADYYDQFHPATPIEAELVETLAATRWRIRRLADIEANLFTNHFLENGERRDKTLEDITPEGKLAWSFKKLADNSQSLQLVLRYEATLSRTYDRAFKQLQLLQKQRPPAAPAKLQNEPGLPAEPAWNDHIPARPPQPIPRPSPHPTSPQPATPPERRLNKL